MGLLSFRVWNRGLRVTIRPNIHANKINMALAKDGSRMMAVMVFLTVMLMLMILTAVVLMLMVQAIDSTSAATRYIMMGMTFARNQPSFHTMSVPSEYMGRCRKLAAVRIVLGT